MSEPTILDQDYYVRLMRDYYFNKPHNKRNIGVMEGILYAIGQLEYGLVYSNKLILEKAGEYVIPRTHDGF